MWVASEQGYIFPRSSLKWHVVNGTQDFCLWLDDLFHPDMTFAVALAWIKIKNQSVSQCCICCEVQHNGGFGDAGYAAASANQSIAMNILHMHKN